MSRILKIIIAMAIFLTMLVVWQSCKMVKDVTAAVTNLQKMQFKLENVSGFTVGGINIQNKKSISDISAMDAVRLTQMVTSKKLPVSFILNVAAKNPNDGTNNARKSTATLTSFDWNLYIDGVKTISGDIKKSIEIPGTGQSTIIPLEMSLDMYEFLGNRGYDGLLNLALAIGGVNGSPVKLKLDARPRVSTPFGEMNYPGRLTIVDKTWN